MPIYFENPPVDEVVVAVHFSPPLSDLRSEHIGLFWQRIRSDFPVIEQRLPTPAGDALGPILTSIEPFPMPRFWFIAEDNARVIQVDKSTFVFNWQRGSEDYPGFNDCIKPTFDKYYEIFRDFVRDEFGIVAPDVRSYELAYTNIIEKSPPWCRLHDTAQVLPQFTIPYCGIDDSECVGFDCNYGYFVAVDLQINVAIRNVVAVQQPESTALMLEIKAVGSPQNTTKPGMDIWFKRAHDAVVQCFLSITDAGTQADYWGRKET